MNVEGMLRKIVYLPVCFFYGVPLGAPRLSCGGYQVFQDLGFVACRALSIASLPSLRVGTGTFRLLDCMV